MCTYKWQSAIRALTNLWLIDIDEDPRVAERSAAAVARHYPRVYPADGLLVNEFYGGQWARLYDVLLVTVFFISPALEAFN